MAKEYVFQCFQYDHDKRFIPLENVASRLLKSVLKNRLGFSFDDEDINIMTQSQLSDWYGGDGVENTFKQLKDTCFGSQMVKEDDIKAKKAKKKDDAKKGKGNTSAETEAIRAISSDNNSESEKEDEEDEEDDSEDSAPPPNQAGSSKGKIRKASKKAHAEEPVSKRPKSGISGSGVQSTASPDPSNRHSLPKSLSFNKNKGKAPAKILAPDSDDTMEQLPDPINSSAQGSDSLAPVQERSPSFPSSMED